MTNQPGEPPDGLPKPFAAKREIIRKNQEDFQAKMATVSPNVQAAYRQARSRIDELFETHDDLETIETELYRSDRAEVPLSREEIGRLVELLTHPAQGWDVRLSTPDGNDESVVALVFRFNPVGD